MNLTPEERAWLDEQEARLEAERLEKNRETVILWLTKQFDRQLENWLLTNEGRFATFYAERTRPC